MDADRFSQLNDVGIEMIHLPVLLGAVSFFHSVPGVEKLNLTSCLLARIFSRDITSWDDPDILLKNPALQTSPTGLDITVVHRVKGSSSTDGVTNVSRSCSFCFLMPWKSQAHC
jgi:ABC-type phosphate transport system substrate-binding protein